MAKGGSDPGAHPEGTGLEGNEATASPPRGAPGVSTEQPPTAEGGKGQGQVQECERKEPPLLQPRGRNAPSEALV